MLSLVIGAELTEGVQTYLWALPVISMYSMREGQRKAFGDDSNIRT